MKKYDGTPPSDIVIALACFWGAGVLVLASIDLSMIVTDIIVVIISLLFTLVLLLIFILLYIDSTNR